MEWQGGCYCGAVRYAVSAKPRMQAQCHCRACTHVSGGGPNYFMLIPPEGFAYAKGAPASFRRADKPDAVTRYFCATCGTHLVSHRPGLRHVVLKVGTLDDPSVYDGPKLAIFCAEKQPYQVIPEGLPAFEALPE
jgi:hypothetical protein